MIQNENFEPVKKKPLILFSPLDWGLGHTTRSIPLIREFINEGCHLVIACSSTQRKLLADEFPTLEFLPLEGYGVTYGHNRPTTRFKLLLQIPNILTRIKFEHSWISDFFSKNTVDAVVSDNRYGFQTPHLPCILITHQLSARTGSLKFFDHFVQFLLYRWIKRFTQCWIPDFEKEPWLSGSLSHPRKMPATIVKYTGPLSRFNLQPALPYLFDVMVILSGPEPQRTILENIILSQLPRYGKSIIILRGLPGNSPLPNTEGARLVNHASTEELNRLITQSALIISRSGYTTIMDLVKLKKKMVLIPTPGQPEQEYLAEYLFSKKLAVFLNQTGFSLNRAEEMAGAFDFRHLDKEMDEYKSVVHEFVSSLKK